MKKIIIVALTLLTTVVTGSSEDSSAGTIIRRYVLAEHPETNHKILILSAAPAPKSLAHIHQIIFRTYLNMLMVEREPVELITEDTVPSTTEERQGEGYKQYLEYYQTRTIKYVPRDYRTKIDADILAIFHLLSREFESLFEVNILSNEESWPSKKFFESNPAYQIIKEEILNKAPQLTVEEYLQHLKEQSEIFNDTETFSIIPPDMLLEMKEEFAKKMKFVVNWLGNNKESIHKEMVQVILSAMETGSQKTINMIAHLCTDPGVITARAGFLQEILTSQQEHDTIFFAFSTQTEKITQYLKRMGYETIIAANLIKRDKEDNIRMLDGWSMINLFLQTFATTKQIQRQADFFQTLLDGTD